jgi:hypothetical protein
MKVTPKSHQPHNEKMACHCRYQAEQWPATAGTKQNKGPARAGDQNDRRPAYFALFFLSRLAMTVLGSLLTLSSQLSQQM